MSKIDELLKNEKVEWKKLGEIATCFAGGTPKTTNKSYYDGVIPWIRSGEIKFNIIKSSERNITIEGLNNSSAKLIRPNSVVVAMTGATVGRSAVVEFETSSNQSVAAIETNESIIKYKYLFYYLADKYEELKGMGQGALTSLNIGTIKKLIIPIPTLKTQEKIVEILDKFTEYVTELQAELQDSTKQYEYYRDMLLSEEYLNKKSKKYLIQKKQYLSSYKLEELVKFKNGKDWKILDRGNIPVYGSGGKMDVYVNKYSYNKPTVLIPRKGSIDNVFYLNEPFWNVDTIFYTVIDERKILPKYFYYFIENYDIKALSTDSTRPSLTQDVLNKIKINLPSLEIQEKVVEVLDKFQSLLADTEGLLPQEIEQRQKQYEYFREKLLTFDGNVVQDKTRQDKTRQDIIISNRYFDLLEEACDIVGIDFISCTREKLSDCIRETKNIKWDNEEEFNYIDLSSIDRQNNSILETNLVNKNNAPSRARQIIRKNDVLFGTTRPLLKRYYFVGKEYDGQLCSTGFCVLRADTEKILPKWIYYNIMTKRFLEFVKMNEKGTSYPAISDSNVKQFKIPVPSLAVQEHVVSILDKFDELINDISTGIPKEIELRQKEYEYYRERLLSFPR